MSAAESLGPPFPPPPPVEDVAVALDAVGEVVSGTLDADEGVESGDSMGTKREKSATSAQSWPLLPTMPHDLLVSLPLHLAVWKK